MPELRDERVTIGGLEVLGRLSTGGMGEVLLARKRGAHGFEKLIAVKTIRGDLARRTDMRRMFLDEARLMARLDHPAIAQVYDFGEEKDVLYLAMEYVPGIALSKLLKRAEMKKEPLPPAIAARIVAEICRGLHAAHELKDAEGKPLGVVHRDVSPHNLMLTFDGRVKILDFGIAWRRDREAPETEIGVIKGKISYVAPEQITGGDVDRRSDVYSAAVVLHELLVGRKLFAGQGVSLADTLQRKRVPRPASVVKTIPPALDDVVMRALSPKLEDRFPDAREMAVALERVVTEIGGETVEEFAERELAEEREMHRARIQAITVEGPPREIVPLLPPRDPETLADRPSSKSSSSSREAAAPFPRSRWTVGRVLALGIAAGALVFILYPSRTDPTSSYVAPRFPPPEEKRPDPDPDPPFQRVAHEPVKTATNVVTAPKKEEEVSTASTALALFAALSESVGITATTATTSVEETEEEGEPVAEEEPEVIETPPIPPPKPREPVKPARPAVAQKSPPKKAAPRPVQQKKIAKTAPKKVPSFGYLTIESAQSSAAFVDGRNLGLTPINNLRLSAGKHDVQLRHPVSRVLRWKSVVTVQPGKRHRVRLR